MGEPNQLLDEGKMSNHKGGEAVRFVVPNGKAAKADHARPVVGGGAGDIMTTPKTGVWGKYSTPPMGWRAYGDSSTEKAHD